MPLVTQEQRWRIHVTSFYDYISDQHRDWFILTSAVALTGRADEDSISPAAGPRPSEAHDLLDRHLQYSLETDAQADQAMLNYS